MALLGLEVQALRRLSNIFAGVSLLLLAAVCVVWARSYRLTERVDWRNAGGWRSVRTAAGHLEVSLLVAAVAVAGSRAAVRSRVLPGVRV